MRRPLFHRIGLFAAVCLLAVISIVSAARMAPNASDSAEVAAFLAAGGTLADLCGDLPSDHDHPCPFCRSLNDPPAVAFAPRVDRVIPYVAWQRLRDLTHGSQQDNPGVSARAPPARA
ncbi:hypothetical protein [Pseudoruegeria sp. SK021]|uniref:hypothetical protein n=1 Tax=Pseudoruegeria sp. SK021 TaxID=1933035 RepID=UPI000A3241FD|nr:hypothetical protein [Pseudoruegeria sp. SK021]